MLDFWWVVKLNLIVELAFVESSVMQGDYRNAIKRIDSRLRKENRKLSGRKGGRSADQIAVLSGIRDLLEEKITPESLRKKLSKSGSFMTIPDSARCADRLIYFLEYCRDRYNLNYPEYDQKRCGDL